MSKQRIQILMKPFRLPNFLKAESGVKFGVGEMTDEDAAAYWDWMKEKWLDHVAQKRAGPPISYWT